jgi:4-hydroxy-3-methylbut-2-en-1-yl diphosphate synthase IspG/GcpE
LLEDGIGDTVRVSLTDPPEMELAPARALANLFSARGDRPAPGLPGVPAWGTSWSPRETHLTADRHSRWRCGGLSFPVTLMSNAQDVPGVSEMSTQLPEPDSRIPAERGEKACPTAC